jgi:hypothetical protein
MTEEIQELTIEESMYFDELKRGYYDYTTCLDGEYEKKVIIAAKGLALEEFGTNCDISVFITHGQDLQIWLAKGFYIHPPEMKEIADLIADRLKVYFGLNFTNRSRGERSLGFIVDENQTEYYQRNNR